MDRSGSESGPMCGFATRISPAATEKDPRKRFVPSAQIHHLWRTTISIAAAEYIRSLARAPLPPNGSQMGRLWRQRSSYSYGLRTNSVRDLNVVRYRQAWHRQCDGRSLTELKRLLSEWCTLRIEPLRENVCGGGPGQLSKTRNSWASRQSQYSATRYPTRHRSRAGPKPDRSLGIDGGECVDALKIENAIARQR
jgi:hypothetical protein